MLGDPEMPRVGATTNRALPSSAGESNLVKMGFLVCKLDPNDNSGFVYGDFTDLPNGSILFYFAEIETVEDWGCGTAVFRRFCLGKYIGIDGSKTPFASRVK